MDADRFQLDTDQSHAKYSSDLARLKPETGPGQCVVFANDVPLSDFPSETFIDRSGPFADGDLSEGTMPYGRRSLLFSEEGSLPSSGKMVQPGGVSRACESNQ